jgi:hypothetical protein
MPRRLHCHRKSALAALIMLACAALGGCASTPAEPVPFKQVPAERIVRPGYTEPLAGLVAVDVRRERSRDVIVRFRNALVYVDGERVTDLMNGEHVVFYLSPGVHRIGVSTQFDPVVALAFLVTADPRLPRSPARFNNWIRDVFAQPRNMAATLIRQTQALRAAHAQGEAGRSVSVFKVIRTC